MRSCSSGSAGRFVRKDEQRPLSQPAVLFDIVNMAPRLAALPQALWHENIEAYGEFQLGQRGKGERLSVAVVRIRDLGLRRSARRRPDAAGSMSAVWPNKAAPENIATQMSDDRRASHQRSSAAHADPRLQRPDAR
jgi:hypothetical protein